MVREFAQPDANQTSEEESQKRQMRMKLTARRILRNGSKENKNGVEERISVLQDVAARRHTMSDGPMTGLTSFSRWVFPRQQ